MGNRGFVDVEAGRLYYESDGDGPLFLVTGGALDVRMWEPQVDALSRVCTFACADLRGYGRSSEPRGRYRHCDDLRLLLEALGFDRAWLGGQSMGATVSIDFALAHPDAVVGLILAPPLPVLGWQWVEEFPAVPEVAALMQQMNADYTGWHFRHTDPGRFEATDQIARLGQITVPSLVMVGGS